MHKCLKRDSFSNVCHENEEHSKYDSASAFYRTTFLVVPTFKAPLTSVEFHPLIYEGVDLLDITCSNIQLLSFRVPYQRSSTIKIMEASVGMKENILILIKC